jgi:hypothetical protein
MRIPSVTRPAHAGPKSSSSSFFVTRGTIRRSHWCVRECVNPPDRLRDANTLAGAKHIPMQPRPCRRRRSH